MNSYLHIKSFLGQEKTIELLGEWSPFYCKDKVKNIKNWFIDQGLLSIHPKKELEMTPLFGEGMPSDIQQLQKCPKRSQKDIRKSRNSTRTIREKAKPKPIGTDLTHMGTGCPNWKL
ncbi:hypothetical protein O181_087399 [Austropuccinia psidii MF-1]|uniref:Uncharacterized protein n=1 Tax=Austropuccinia psidii MF-1 TaxID=1389203 RepID=A0A9Q3P1J3_9BASI|nr:hypothetical protein [Austropuccinia psidii MF-1]